MSGNYGIKKANGMGSVYRLQDGPSAYIPYQQG